MKIISVTESHVVYSHEFWDGPTRPGDTGKYVTHKITVGRSFLKTDFYRRHGLDKYAL